MESYESFESYEFYEQCASINKVYDTPEQTATWLKEADEALLKIGDVNNLVRKVECANWHIFKLIVRLRAHESGRPIMSDFAVIHNCHVGLSELSELFTKEST